MGASSLVVRALAKLPGGLGRFLPCGVGSHMSRLRHLGWKSVFSGLTSPLESCHHQCLEAVCGVLGYPKISASELLDGTLTLRHCATLFTMRFPHGGLEMGGCKRWDVTPGHLLDEGGHSSDDRSSTVKRVRLTRMTRPGALFSHVPDPGHPTPRRWKRLCSFL